MHLIGMAYNFVIDWLIWLLAGLSRVIAALVAIPLVFFMKPPGGMSHGQSIRKRLAYIGKTIATAFKSKNA